MCRLLLPCYMLSFIPQGKNFRLRHDVCLAWAALVLLSFLLFSFSRVIIYTGEFLLHHNPRS